MGERRSRLGRHPERVLMVAGLLVALLGVGLNAIVPAEEYEDRRDSGDLHLIGMDDAEREPGRDRRIHRVAARGEHRGPGLGGVRPAQHRVQPRAHGV